MNVSEKTALKALYAQIEDIMLHFKEIRGEAAGIVRTSQMPDAALHLNDVLQSTEEAAMIILDAATAIGSLAEDPRVHADVKEGITQQVARIFEAAGFQDISGQRIKKVLLHLNELEAQLLRLSETAQRQAAPPPKDTLLQGPSLSSEAPSQDDIDRLFGSL